MTSEQNKSKRQRQRRPTVAEIQADPNISKAQKQQLKSVPQNDPIPAQLLRWAREVFRVGREENLDDLEITRCVQIYAQHRGWHKVQIANVLEKVLA